MTAQARLVIVGAGIVGSATALHLARMGWRDILVLDMGRLDENPGSTSHAPGGLGALTHSKLLTQMAQYTSDMMRGLEDYSPDRKMFSPNGSMEIAVSPERFEDFVRLHGESQGYHAESRLLSPAEVHDLVPVIDPKAIAGAILIAKGAVLYPMHVNSAIQRDAAAGGAVRFVGHTEVTEVIIEGGRVTGVRTNNPEMPVVRCEQVLLATNVWGPNLGDRLGVPLPLRPFEHIYAEFRPVEGMERFDPSRREDEAVFPIMRELDSSIYMRQHWNGLGVGSYRHVPLMVQPRDMGPNATRAFTAEHFAEGLEHARRLVPALRDAPMVRSFNGIFAFPVDGYPILGPTQTEGLWTAIAVWITHAGGAAKSVAEWMTYGESEWDLRQADVNRFHRFQATKQYIEVSSSKSYREVYDLIHPNQPPSEPRNLRHSPFDARWRDLGAEMSVFAGYELPNWFGANEALLAKYEAQIPQRDEWSGRFWSPIAGAEHLATRESVGLFDLTGLSVIEVEGAGAVTFANYLCSNDVHKPVGSVVYTTWLTPRGGVRRDLAVSRVAEDRFWFFVGEATLPRDLDWVRRHAPRDGSVSVRDISSAYTAVGLWGPNARRVLEKVTGADVGNESFPYFTSRWIDVGPVPAYALRVSYAGELGWELHLPSEQALPAFDALWAAGREFGIVAAGATAFDSLRVEKGYRLWGRDVHTEYNPYEAGLGWTVRLKKGDFIGRAAAASLRTAPLKRKLACVAVDAPRFAALGYESIHAGGQCIGYVASANYGYTVGRWIAFGYLPIEHAAVGSPVEIEYNGKRYPGLVAEEPLFDPAGERLRA